MKLQTSKFEIALKKNKNFIMNSIYKITIKIK